MIQFIFNQHGVCENPISKTFKCLKNYEAVVDVAIVQNKKWSYSIAFNGKNQGWSQPLIFHAKHNVYSSREDAYKAGVQLLLLQVKANNDYKHYNAIIEMLQDELQPTYESQLSLF